MRKGKAKPSAAERFGEKQKSYMHAFTRRSPSSTSRQLFRLDDRRRQHYPLQHVYTCIDHLVGVDQHSHS
jgi:hypothetical protein